MRFERFVCNAHGVFQRIGGFPAHNERVFANLGLSLKSNVLDDHGITHLTPADFPRDRYEQDDDEPTKGSEPTGSRLAHRG
jgi:hypothetical protein